MALIETQSTHTLTPENPLQTYRPWTDVQCEYSNILSDGCILRKWTECCVGSSTSQGLAACWEDTLQFMYQMSIKHVGGEGQEGWERWAMKTHAGKDWVAALPSAGDLCRTEHLPPNWFGELRLSFST